MYLIIAVCVSSLYCKE